MDELINAFKAHMYDKARSPFLTALSLSWVSWNLKTLVIIFGTADIAVKLALLKNQYPNLEAYIYHWVLYPIASASLFIGFYPLIALVAFSYWNFLNNIIKKIQLNQDDKVPISAEDARLLRKLISDVSIEKQKVIDDLVDKNTVLMKGEENTHEMIATLENQKRDISKTVESKELEIATLTTEVIKLTGEIDELKKKADELAEIKTQQFTNKLNAAEKDAKFTKFIKDAQIDTALIPESEKENALHVLNLILQLKEKYGINMEQLKLLLLLIAHDGAMASTMLKQRSKLEDIKLNAILSILENKQILITPQYGNSSVHLTENFKREVYEFGILSAHDYKNVLIKAFGI